MPSNSVDSPLTSFNEQSLSMPPVTGPILISTDTEIAVPFTAAKHGTFAVSGNVGVSASGYRDSTGSPFRRFS